MTITKYLLPFVLGLVACSADNGDLFPPLDSGVGDAGVDQDVELGQTAQAMYLPFAMGFEGGKENGVAYPQCSAPFSAGMCAVPQVKNIDINVMTNTCPLASVQRAKILAAANAVRDFANGVGWNVLTQENGSPNRFLANQVKVRCTTSHPNAKTHGETLYPTFNLGACTPVGAAGVVCTFASATSHVYVNNINTFISAQGWTGTQQGRYVENTFRHEVFHALGIGHNGSSNQLMGQASTGTQNALLIPNNVERDAMECYSPGGSSPACN